MVELKLGIYIDQDIELDVLYNAMTDDDKLLVLEWILEDFPNEKEVKQ